MIAEYQKKSNIGVGAGFLAEVVGRGIQLVGGSNTSAALLVLGGVIALAGVVLFIWGCVNYCIGKGYSGWLGLLGLVSCLGLIVLIFLPDKHKGGGPPVSGTGYGPTQPGVWPPPPSA